MSFFLAEIWTYFSMTTQLLLLFVDGEAGLEAISVAFGCSPQDTCGFERLSGTRSTQSGRLLESQCSLTNKTLYYYSAIKSNLSSKNTLLTVYQ